ncbi:transmembrane and ubiquitin-like domain-containing protein 1 [Microplitis mediator]|uniref:transmembrane and ubiquitin-like domain-containing protein 1 n=1 Tax=Microplitis mediator TaxID=375433 RepID=UPI002555DF58|nr:transmembrane and ubiquitin-like domain-containing protein 1 [Microplitis mediator]XP_057335554.1 transmembrane and ubiquitin-like domain-containing protein 1 [Microplitis mediator]XP_057335555.1 transmembrane and ubiquitin-like domain-containing protein 1 [Microplitis mediator]
MTLIEGVGDEVTDFFIVVGVILIGWIAWCSTNISEQPLIRTVLILQHRTRTRIAELRANNSSSRIIDNRNSSAEESSEETIVPSNSSSNEPEENCPVDNQQATAEATGSLATGTATSEQVLIEAMDSLNDDSNLLHRPVKLSASSDSDKPDEAEQSGPEPALAGDSPQDICNEDNEITIKLKFINDDQKIVTGRLKEMLSEFKRRHFQVELDAQKRVRLVFNGQVLQPDSETLEKCGLFHNCVVHCLVHQPLIPTSTQSSTSSSRYSSNGNSNQSFQNLPGGDGPGISSLHQEWDLSRLLVSILTLVLAIAWYSRYHYAQLFTVTTTMALYALTALFTLALFGNFFPDQESLREVE